jgi:hypothetical protein
LLDCQKEDKGKKSSIRSLFHAVTVINAGSFKPGCAKCLRARSANPGKKHKKNVGFFVLLFNTKNNRPINPAPK